MLLFNVFNVVHEREVVIPFTVCHCPLHSSFLVVGSYSVITSPLPLFTLNNSCNTKFNNDSLLI